MPLTPIENEYSLPGHNTYDIPRSSETPSVENLQINTEEKVRIYSLFFYRFYIFYFLQIVKNETITPSQIINIQKTSDDIVSTEQKIESTITTKSETMPNVDLNESSTKGSYTLPTEKIEN